MMSLAWKASMRETGIGAPPELTKRSDVRSAVFHLGDWSMSENMVVTPAIQVSPSCSMASKARSTSHVDSMSMRAPRR